MFGFLYRTKFCKIKQNYFFVLATIFHLIRGTEGVLERRKALAALVLFVGSRYYLRPIILYNQLERAKRIWNSRRLLERRIAVIRVRVCDGNAMNVR